MNKSFLTKVFSALLIVMLALMALPVKSAYALTCTSNANGNWNAPATWSGCGGGVPGVGDDVVITGETVTVTANAFANLIDFGTGGGTLTVNNAVTLTVTNAITAQNSANGNRTVTLSGAGTINAGSVVAGGTTTTITGNGTTTMTSTIANLNITGGLTINAEHTGNFANDVTFDIPSGIVTVGGTVTLDSEDTGGTGAGDAELTLNGAGPESGTLILTGATPFTDVNNGGGNRTLDANGSTATVIYAGAAQTVRPETYTNLTISGSGIKTVSGNTTVNGNLIVNSGTTLTIGGIDFTVNGTSSITGTLIHNNTAGTKQYTGAVTINSGGVWNNTANENINFRGGLTHNGTTFTAGTGTYSFTNNAQNIGGTSAISIPNLTVTGITLTNNSTTGLTVGTALTGSGGLTQGASSVLNLGGTSTITTLNAGGAGNTINYNGTAQTVRAITYQNLILSGSGLKSMTAGTTVNGTINIIPTAVVSIAGGASIPVNALSLNSTGQVNGSWGSTTSPATNQNNTYFNNAINPSGILNVATNTGLITPTLSVTNTPQNYTGAAQSATVSCSSGGTVSNISTGGAASQTNAGTYAVTADCAAMPGFTALTGASAGNFVINPINQTANVTNSPQNYTGAAQSATVSCSGGGVATNISTGGAASQTNAGTYAVTADCPAVAPNYNAGTGLAAGNFVINPINQTANVTNSPQSYTGAAQSATVSCSGGGVATNISTGGAASQTNAGTYAVTADCPAAAPNYNAGTVGAGNFVINPITPTASITNSPVIYNGAAQTATVACLGGGAATLASGGTGTNVGSYPATVDCAASTNYTAATGLSAGNFVIDPAAPTASITNSPVIYNGSAQTATVACLGGGVATLASGGIGTNVGSYPATVDCAASANYTAAAGLAAGNFVINIANQTITVTTSAPAAAINGSSFNIAATASSGLPVTISVSGVCTVADLDGSVTDGDATVTMTSGAGTCNVFYNQTGDTNFNPAPQVQEDVNATDSPVFTSANNTSFDLGFAGTFNITATGNPSTMVISVSGALPSGITLTDNGNGTASLGGTPGAGTAGVYNLVLTANNGVLPNGTQNFTLTVRNGPTASNINSLPDTGDGSLAENESVVTTLSITELTVEFSRDVYDVPASTTDSDEVDNPANYILVRSATGVFNTLSCAGGVVAPDIINPVTSVTYDNGGGSGPFIATLTLTTPLTTEGYYRLFVCGTTSIVDAVNIGLSLAGNGTTPGTDFVRNFQITSAPIGGGGGGTTAEKDPKITVTALPATGFTPNRITMLAEQPEELAYANLGDLWIEIPALGVKTSIVGVPQTQNGEWDVTWLANNVGWLNGTAFPTWEGNSVVTAHVTNANGLDGPFAKLSKLKFGDQIIVHAFGQKYIFELRNSRMVKPFSTSFAFEDLEDESYLTLITCQVYLPKSDTYLYRRVIRAVLVSVTNE